MFTQFKNIDTAFSHIKRFSIFLILACLLISCFAIYKSFDMVNAVQAKVYILANGKAIEAFSTERKDNLPVELRDHIKTFHHLFFTLDPDDKVIQTNVSNSLNLADESAKKAYDNLRERGYFNNLISANISQEITIDSTSLDINQYPFYFKCYATQRLIRSTSATTRKLVTQGYIRNVSRSDNNPHGFLIQRWETLENKDEPLNP
ncbi:conjugative transposon protein TraK [Pedobacter frigiditerrae]|uniref:Conjugative transposon protein TraK n=1 Tax=Pedobacter frigiditerrae TaxID=2530452 RepID=A0A4R0MXH0_9SPHI|nr:conjugative transposon protein TraK [Pedobacter frigiditerrae]TCC91930.1 conjugative transposon protein TraK [Pedobacter frigiditerrae]